MIDLSIPSGAVFSLDGKYRYALWRIWSSAKPLRLQIGLNPSKAGAVRNDPTVTRGIVRADRDGFGGFFMGNLYGYVSTDPKALLRDGDFVGELTDRYLKEMIALANQTICGWGSFPAAAKRAGDVLRMIPEPYCFGVNKDGQPKHPLYLPYSASVVKYLTREWLDWKRDQLRTPEEFKKMYMGEFKDADNLVRVDDRRPPSWS